MMASPSYINATSLLLSELNDKHEENAQALHDALVKAYGSDDVHKQFIQELDGVANASISLQQSFVRIGEAVGRFDAEHYPSPNGGQLPPFEREWREHYTDYMFLLRGSRDFATHIIARVNAYRLSILPMLLSSGITDSEKKDRVDEFLQAGMTKGNQKPVWNLRDDELEAQQVSDRFTELDLRVRSFDVRIQQAIADAKVATNHEVSDLQNDLQEMVTKMKQLQAERERMRSIGGVLGGVVGGFGLGCFGGMVATATLVPHALPVTVSGAVGALGGDAGFIYQHLGIATGIDSQYERLRNAYEEASKRQTVLLDIVGCELQKALGSMGDVSFKLGTMVNIFDYLQSDAQVVRIHLAKALDSKAPAIFKKGTIDLATVCYQKLEAGVEAFAAGIDAAGLRIPN